jgi:4-oxalocrotonate tautomerase
MLTGSRLGQPAPVSIITRSAAWRSFSPSGCDFWSAAGAGALIGTERGGSNRCLREQRDSEFTEEVLMPLIQVKVIEGVFTEAQKREMVRKLTDAMVSIEGENMRPVTWVIVEEVDSGNWGIGGKPLTTADVKTLAAGKPTG